MKTTCTCAVLLALAIATECSANDRCKPMRRWIKPCTPRAACVDQPSELNIIMTTELIALRKQVEEMTAAAEARDAELAASQEQVANQRDKIDQLTSQLAKHRELAAEAQKQAVETRATMTKLLDEAQASLKTANESADKAKADAATQKKQVAELRKQVRSTRQKLKDANEALEAEKSQDDEPPTQPEQKAISTPPAKDEGSDAEVDDDAGEEAAESE